jgi:hypothetical protein
MSPCAAVAPNAPVLFPELTGTLWSACEGSEEPDEDNPFVPPDTEPKQFTEAEFAALARDFLKRSETLIDLVAPPPWEDEDDIFGGEVFGEERAEYQQSSLANPTAEQRECIARQLMANEANRYPGCTAGFLIALALTYRRILLDHMADPRDKVEVLRRVYSTHEPEWMTAEIVYLHLILLDQCRYLSRPTASIERKEETLRWIYTDPELEERPFSFKNCVKLVTGNTPDFGAIHRRLKEEMRQVLAAWLRESLARKRTADDRQPGLFDM